MLCMVAANDYSPSGPIELLGIEKNETQSREVTKENLKEWSLANA